MANELLFWARALKAVTTHSPFRKERHEELGECVGYRIGGDSVVGKRLNFQTTGWLLRLLDVGCGEGGGIFVDFLDDLLSLRYCCIVFLFRNEFFLNITMRNKFHQGHVAHGSFRASGFSPRTLLILRFSWINRP